MSIENFYFHCGTEWSDPYCDSFHNDRCPVCNAEIEPYKSKEFSGPEFVHHPLSNELAFDFASAMISATQKLVDKVEGIRGIDVEHYVGHRINETLLAKGKASHAISDGDQLDPFQSVINSGDDLKEALDILVDDLESIRGADIDVYAPEEFHKAKIAINDWANYKQILAERLADERKRAT